MRNLILSVVSLCVMAFHASEAQVSGTNRSSSHEDAVTAQRHTGPLKKLAADLHAGDAQVRMGAIRELGALPDVESKRMLLYRFGSMPKPAASTSARQVEKTEILRQVLPKLENAEKNALLSDTFQNEIAEMKRAQKIGRGKYYPKDLALFSLASLEGYGLSQGFRDELDQLALDPAFPQSIREEMLTAVFRHDLRAMGVQRPEAKARFAIKHIAVRPRAPIPWEIYTNTQQRVAYAKSQAFQERQKVMAEWLKSNEAVQTLAYERLLQSLGIPAVKELVATLDQNDIPSEKRDSLAVLAADLLRKSVGSDRGFFDPLRSILDDLGEYIEGMENTGAFGRRAVAAADLNAVCELAGIQRRIVACP